MTKVGDILVDGRPVGEIQVYARLEDDDPSILMPDFGAQDLIPYPHEDSEGGFGEPPGGGSTGHEPSVSPGTSRAPRPGGPTFRHGIGPGSQRREENAHRPGGPTFRPGIGPGSRRGRVKPNKQEQQEQEQKDEIPREEGDLSPPGRSGGRFNVHRGPARLRPDERATVVLSNGEKVVVNKRAASQFRGFFEDLIKAGAPVHSLGGLGNRLGNASQHPVGLAVDWAQLRRNVVSPDVARWMARNQGTLNALENKWGMSGGEHWRTPDRGHFSIDTLYGRQHLARLKEEGRTPAGREIEGPRDAEAPSARAPDNNAVPTPRDRPATDQPPDTVPIPQDRPQTDWGANPLDRTPVPRDRPTTTEAVPTPRQRPTLPSIDEPPATPHTPGAAAQTTGGLRSERARFTDELRDSATHERFLRLTQAENPENPQAFMESVMNRAAARRTTLRQAMDDRHYFPNVSLVGKAPVDRAGMEAALRRVEEGSNLINFATGNASGTFGFGYNPDQRHQGYKDPYTYRTASGERYGVENNPADLRWAARMRQQRTLAAEAESRAARDWDAESKARHH